ncbi:hypothetical protein [Actinocrispum sp. NPDC049592]|uniref:hypothetical protein n=1 Tax=Actinocrispum sp. NPDC049592 TaxID=3154835 RepID=UPI00342FFB93
MSRQFAMPRARRRALSVMLLSLTVCLSGLVVPAVTAVAAPAAVPDETPDAASALLAARAANKSVRVLSQTDESTEVRANPNGSMTMTVHRQPVRVKQSGKWAPVDLTLVRRPDGTVGPKVAPIDVVLSNGGTGSPIVKVGKAGTEVGLGWPEALPEPRLAGPTATYPEVLPGVDLKVTAEVDGFSQVLVVKTPEAARNPKLKRISFGSYTRNTKVKTLDGASAWDGTRTWVEIPPDRMTNRHTGGR